MAANCMFDMPQRRKEREFKECIDINRLTERELRVRFRFGKDGINYLCDLLHAKLERPTKRSKSLSVLQQILIALRFFATGSFLQVVGDCVGVDKSTVSRVVNDVTVALVELSPQFILWPSEHQKREVRNGFYKLGGFPNVVGCIDGTHIRIQAPAEDEKSYVNRKNYHSINVMAVCNHKGAFTNINASWPGSAHDSHVFRTSRLHDFLLTNHKTLEAGIILGDSGYACLPFLLTPYRNPDSIEKHRYQDRHTSTRVTIERTFGRWKRRFHVLHSEVKMVPNKVCRIAIACAVLHNIAIKLHEPEPTEDDNQADNQMPQTPPYVGHETGQNIRNHITDEFFRH